MCYNRVMKDKIDTKLDDKWADRVREIGRCERCGSKNNLSAHHIIGKTSRATRWDLENGICLCFSCHRIAHDFPDKFIRWLKTIRDYDSLVVKGAGISKMSMQDREKILKNLCIKH
jgi:5-methylcytosine-specific restriction endonuclease McrA